MVLLLESGILESRESDPRFIVTHSEKETKVAEFYFREGSSHIEIYLAMKTKINQTLKSIRRINCYFLRLFRSSIDCITLVNASYSHPKNTSRRALAAPMPN